MVKRHGETISDQAYKDVITLAIPNSYIDVKFAVHRDRSSSLKQIQSTMRNMNRSAERGEREKVGIDSRKPVMVAVRSRKGHGVTERTRCLGVDSWAIKWLTTPSVTHRKPEAVEGRRE